MSGSARPVCSALAVCAGLVVAVGISSPARAQVDMMSTGSPGPVSLLDFAGDSEAAPTDGLDASQAAAECDTYARGRRAVFAGALAWAPDTTPGMHNDWRYVRVVAGAVDAEGHTLTGDTSPYYAAYDDQAVTLPAVAVFLPRDGIAYTPVLMVQFYDSTYRLTGTTMIGAQSGAWRVSVMTPSFGDYWYVAATDLVRC
jgi:hypothetical protein